MRDASACRTSPHARIDAGLRPVRWCPKLQGNRRQLVIGHFLELPNVDKVFTSPRFIGKTGLSRQGISVLRYANLVLDVTLSR